jgi:hypothetical protein
MWKSYPAQKVTCQVFHLQWKVAMQYDHATQSNKKKVRCLSHEESNVEWEKDFYKSSKMYKQRDILYSI